jgi:type IV secretory pathway VirB2 component (pilin)
MNSSRSSSMAFGFVLLALISRTAFASSAGMPWEGPLATLVRSLTGPVAKAIGVAAIVIAALGMAMSEGGHASKTFLRIIFALAITFTASTFGLQFLGFSGGLAL